MIRSGLTFLVIAIALVAAGQAQTSPEVGNAVLLATNSIQIDRDTVVASGDCVVNVASTTAILGENDLSLDQGVTTPAGFALKANSVDIDGGAIVGGNVFYNILQNNGTIQGALVTPVSLPIISTLPQLLDGTAGTQAISVGNGQSSTLAAGSYAALSVGRDATLHLSGGTYVFSGITTDRGASIIFDAGADVVVKGNVTLGANATITNASGLTTKHKILFVHGTVALSKDNTVRASIDAPNGSIVASDNLQLTGTLVARDIQVGRSSNLSLRSGFRNLAPVANAQDVSTSGTTPLTITLTGFDGDNDPLTFSIVTQPSNGTLSALTSTGPSSATVVYTPNSSDPEDAFVFRVTDSEGASGQATVSINGGRVAPPATVSVDDASADVLENEATTLPLPGSASNGATLTFSIVGSGPAHGTLGAITQPPSAGEPASVVYTPAQDYTGPDSFQFQGCATVCDSGTYTLNVAGRTGEPADLAPDINVSGAAGTDVPIELPGGSTSSQSTGRFVLRPTAAVLVGAAVAGNVADANNDGLGDNHNALPGSTPGLMSAGVGQSGGAGSNGTTRMEIEWDVANFAGSADALQSATVLLRTNRGTTDSADTFFYAIGVDNDGQLTDNDYERTAEQIGNVTMPVPQSQSVGADGTFSFDVLAQLRAALNAGLTHFTVQGRVNESAQTSVRGLQVYTTASGNLGSQFEPQLGLATAGVTPPRTYRILSLPSVGALFDGNTAITSVPYTLSSSLVTYQAPNTVAQTSFNYEVSLGTAVDSGIVHISIFAATCATDPSFCNTGRGD